MALLTFAGIPAAQCADAHPKRHRQQPPNIVLIHLDDMGYGELPEASGDGLFIINEGKIGALTQHLYDTLTGIQWGKLEDKYGWTKQL